MTYTFPNHEFLPGDTVTCELVSEAVAPEATTTVPETTVPETDGARDRRCPRQIRPRPTRRRRIRPPPTRPRRLRRRRIRPRRTRRRRIRPRRNRPQRRRPPPKRCRPPATTARSWGSPRVSRVCRRCSMVAARSPSSPPTTPPSPGSRHRPERDLEQLLLSHIVNSRDPRCSSAVRRSYRGHGCLRRNTAGRAVAADHRWRHGRPGRHHLDERCLTGDRRAVADDALIERPLVFESDATMPCRCAELLPPETGGGPNNAK